MTSRRASDFAAERIRQIRTARGWTAKDLAARCAKIGAPEITASVIANIETGRRDQQGRRRRDLTMDETLTLAYALEVPPVLLFLPLSGDLEVTPSIHMNGYTVASWVTGDDSFLRNVQMPVKGPLTEEDRSRLARWRLETRPLDLLRRLYVSVAIFHRIEDTEPDAARKVVANIDQPGVDLLNWLWNFGVVPPPLPRKLVDVLRDPGAFEPPLEVPVDLLTAEDEAEGDA